jgi:peptidoglycan/xylan/chitin deacetylase (PgdA/CDA1 family)
VPGKKTIVARAIGTLALPQVLTRVRGQLWDEIMILAYHRVLDLTECSGFEFDEDLVSASTVGFRWQMEYVRRHLSPVTFRQLIEHLDYGIPLPPRPVIVTFDDGFDDNYHHVFPVLKSLEMPATFFVSTGYIGKADTFWFDWLVHLCRRASRAREPVEFAGLKVHGCAEGGQETLASAEALAHANTLPDHELRQALQQLEKQLGVSAPSGGCDHSRPLTWEQVREMAAAGLEFGSHTVTHAILSNTADHQLDEELAASKRHLEQELRRPIEVISYPVGREVSFNQRVIDRARAAGYRLGVSYIPGVNPTRQVHPFRLRRLHVERETLPPDFAGMLALPELLS